VITDYQYQETQDGASTNYVYTRMIAQAITNQGIIQIINSYLHSNTTLVQSNFLGRSFIIPKGAVKWIMSINNSTPIDGNLTLIYQISVTVCPPMSALW